MSCEISLAANDGDLESAIYTGEVFHQRVVPKHHAFTYKIFLYWIKLSEINRLNNKVKGFSDLSGKRSIVNFTRSDYLGDPSLDLQQSVLSRMSELNHEPLAGEVFMLGQVRTFGLYFSPVNFYYLRDKTGHFTHMLAEVSNTPWNQRHHYLVDLKEQKSCDKAFHVSPFNPIDMTYHWSVPQPNENIRLQLICSKQIKHFEAAINLKRTPLTSRSLKQALLSIPSMTIKTMAGIYWQALKLFVKRVPVYTHP
ncbi:DUF1365 domain-containing protein [Glaciecola siphonariae]|uniref:DUF1365 domain-containing protein n=1 Tax=Glaciecola siphonariae TaxID=521012 RepID=A0ABV9LZ03_9ALTE